MTNNFKSGPIVEFKNVFLSHGETEILRNLSFSIFPGEIVTIAGPSGSGKSTILRIISNLAHIDSGEVIVRADRLGMAFQHGALFNSMTVWENIALALTETTNLTEKEINERVYEVLDIVNLEHTAEMNPSKLSGGMQKRISIARALALKPELLLYDEPSTGLDPATAAKLEKDMVKFRDEIGVTSIVVTHDKDTIANVSDRVLILYKGAIYWNGNKNEFFTEKSPYPLSFRERCSIEECINNHDDNSINKKS